MFKKGSLSLSINAIVVLILAVTMLGLGLLFMQNMMGGAMGQLADVSDTVKDQMIERIRSSNEKLVFDTNDFSVKRSGSQEYYFGIMNQEDTDKTFYFLFSCTDAMDETANTDSISFDYIPSTIPLGRNEIDVQKVIIRASPQAIPTSYRCGITIDEEEVSDHDSSETYARRWFYVTVS